MIWRNMLGSRLWGTNLHAMRLFVCFAVTWFRWGSDMRYCGEGLDGKLRSWYEQDPHRHWAGTLIFNPRHAPHCLVSGSAHSRDLLWPWKVSALFLPGFSVTNPLFPWHNEVDYCRPKWPCSFLPASLRVLGSHSRFCCQSQDMDNLDSFPLQRRSSLCLHSQETLEALLRHSLSPTHKSALIITFNSRL